MANESSQVILDASAGVKLNPVKYYGFVRSTFGSLTFTSAVVNDVKRILRVPSRARLRSLKLANQQIDTSGTPALTASLGLYLPNGGAAVSAAFFINAGTQLRTANVTPIEVAFLNTFNQAQRHKRLWEVLGLAADPGIDYEIAFMITAAPATFASGVVTLEALFVVDE